MRRGRDIRFQPRLLREFPHHRDIFGIIQNLLRLITASLTVQCHQAVDDHGTPEAELLEGTTRTVPSLLLWMLNQVGFRFRPP